MGEPIIIYEDNALLVLNKPSGWITNEANTTKNQPVVQTWIKENFDFAISKNDFLRSGVVHRLDKETSGILLIAKSEDVFNSLQAQFKERNVKKTYLALVHGKLAESGEVDVPVGRLPWRRDRFGVLPGGRSSKTSFKVKSLYSKKDKNDYYSLVELKPETGRTHQIRIHMKHVGHPLVSDEFYAGRKTARDDRKWCTRMFLHAYKISFSHPESGESVNFEASLPDDLQDALKQLVTFTTNTG